MTFNVGDIVNQSRERRTEINERIERAFSREESGFEMIGYDSNGKLKANLSLERNIAVTPLTQEEYDNLMQVCEACGWNWWSGEDGLATDNNYYSPGDGVSLEVEKDCLMFATKNYYERRNYKAVLPEEFYEEQGINQKTLKEINEWFETNKPNRRSKGK